MGNNQVFAVTGTIRALVVFSTQALTHWAPFSVFYLFPRMSRDDGGGVGSTGLLEAVALQR